MLLLKKSRFDLQALRLQNLMATDPLPFGVGPPFRERPLLRAGHVDFLTQSLRLPRTFADFGSKSNSVKVFA
jgi:hypothetical protein